MRNTTYQDLEPGYPQDFNHQQEGQTEENPHTSKTIQHVKEETRTYLDLEHTPVRKSMSDRTPSEVANTLLPLIEQGTTLYEDLSQGNITIELLDAITNFQHLADAALADPSYPDEKKEDLRDIYHKIFDLSERH